MAGKFTRALDKRYFPSGAPFFGNPKKANKKDGERLIGLLVERGLSLFY